MSTLKRLVGEIHRRSIWQVLAVYLAGSWVAIQVVDALTRTAGLPDWVPPGALILLVIGLPVVLGTAIVQEATHAAGREGGGGSDPGSPEAPTSPSAPTGIESGAPAEASAPALARERGPARAFLQEHLTWRRAVLGGIAAFAVLGFAVTAYFVMRVAGVGPVASLVAQGVLEEREPILLADFRNATSDAGLGSVVTEALRVDLASSRVVSLVEVSEVQEALRRMERDPGAEFTPETAREMAVRDGIKAVLEGEVGSAGSGFILTATLRATADGATLATFRRTAGGPDAVIGAIDRLSQDVRERVGESLRSIRSGAPLWQVTTSSLDALRRYTAAEQALSRGDEMGGIALLREAIALDSAFAMAYRKESVVLRNLGIERTREIEAVERAFHHRTRLPEKERHLAEAAYHNSVTGDKDAVVRAYEAVLRLDPDDPAALNNLANEYQQMGDLDRAEELYRRTIAGPWASPVPRQNLVRNQLQRGDREGAREALAAYAEAHPEDYRVLEMEFWVRMFSGETDAARVAVDQLIDAPGIPNARRAGALMNRALLLAAQGRIEAAREDMASAVRTAAAVGPGLEHFQRLAGIWIDAWTAGDTLRAARVLGEVGRSGLVERVPVAGRDYNFVVSLHLMLGDAEGALEQLSRWRAELPPEFVTPGHRAHQAFYETWARSGRDDPEAVLEALGSLRRDLRCPRCIDWERPGLLSRVGRTAEARDAWLELLEKPHGNFAASLGVMPVAMEETGRLSEELGDRATAADSYRRFIELWSDADAELQPRVERARERLAALDGR